MCAAELDQALTLPPEQAAAQLATMPEGQWFERKSGRVSPKDLARAIVAFANAEGGCIVVGLHDGAVDGVDATRFNDLKQTAHDHIEPVPRVSMEEFDSGAGRQLLLIRIDPGQVVHQHRGGECYLRVGDESRRLGFRERQELEYDRGTAPYDGTPAAIAASELAPEQLEYYRAAIGARSLESMLAARSLVDHRRRLTIAAYLLFADHPQLLLPHAHVRVLRYAESERGTGIRQGLAHEERFEGSLPVQLEQAQQAIENIIPTRRRLAPSGRFEPTPIIPRDAWLEGLVNAVVHRSYSAAGDHIRVEIFPDRVEISSPGRFPGLADPTSPLTITRYARNPRIARVCSDLGIAQELGEGIRRIFDEVRSAGLTDPIYSQHQASVRLVLSAADAIPAEVRERLPRGALAVLDAMRRANRPLGTGQVEELVGITRPTALRQLRALQDERLVRWEGNSSKDPRATWRLR
ncbi:ATP-binding protein [Jiangella muralis]|uniref:ATP-binding protein n=1 Tax=Jiangella muralis TaxID=702383 RepID=UPI00069EFB65|nr:ATP-binding protein [Jiangella muralis]